MFIKKITERVQINVKKVTKFIQFSIKAQGHIKVVIVLMSPRKPGL